MATERWYPRGYCEYANFTALEPELAIFPRFNNLSSRNLVHLMEQVRELEVRLAKFDKEERDMLRKASPLEVIGIDGANRDWAMFAQGAKENDRLQRKMRTVEELEVAMDRYQRALLSHSAVMRLPPPQKHIAKAARRWIARHLPFVKDDHVLCDRKDLVSLYQATHEEDLLSRIVQASFGWMYRERRPLPPNWEEVPFYNEEKTQRLTSFFSVLIAVVMLFGATALLTFANDVTSVQRMVIIGAFTATFASLIGVFTNCKRSELFVAVATYSAVLVVFAEVTNKVSTLEGAPQPRPS
ncbi:Hypothetical protein D9617_10g074820 [Elsinoe fawcettii]|nr:Hypothetical protein D9617_10g074820 [Elsinoe fawcettii]